MNLLDTDVLIDIQRGHAPALAWFAGLLDSLIAACAVGRSATLYTFNVKHYAIVPGLVTAQPYSR